MIVLVINQRLKIDTYLLAVRFVISVHGRDQTQYLLQSLPLSLQV